jgi:ATP-dependent Lhr-like helicase
MSAFERLTPALQYQIAHTLGFRELRPVQDATIDAVLAGENCVVLAPTAGGKTEAAFFPLLSAMDEGDWRPLSVIYLSPIRALLNSQEERLGRYAGTIGRRVFKWHGDVTAAARKKFLAAPADFILTTPESLEAMLMSTRVPTRELFASLRAVVIDEVHAFAADDRGAHLSAVLERLSRFCGKDVQRIGLSATVGNPHEILRWAQGSSKRRGRVIDPKGERTAPELTVDYVGEIENAALGVKALHPGKKRLVFVDSRSGAERLGGLLMGRGVTTFVTHGSLSVTERRDAERAFHEGQDCVIVSTSALELGIDVGDLDHVLQIDCPPTVASLLQRMGRTGRRPGMTPNCTLLTTKDAATLQAAAAVQLLRDGYVEPVRPSRRASHILAHQVMALGVQLGGAAPGDIGAWVHGASAFAELGDEERRAVTAHMLEQRILANLEGKLWLGEEGEKRYGRAHFRQLYAVFDSPKLISVRWDTREIGMVDADFLSSIDSGEERGSFVLAGRPWEIVTVEWERGICVVRPGADGRAPRWNGSPRHLSYELCQAMRRVLVSDAVDPSWSRRATTVLTTMRAEHAFLRDEPAPLIESTDELTWWTYGGGGANALLGRILEAELGERAICRNTSIELTDNAARSSAAVRELIGRWAREGRPTDADARQHAAGAVRGRVSKFQPCLPEELLRDLVVQSVLDVAGARAVVGAVGGA